MRQTGPDHERLKAWASVLSILVVIAGVAYKLRDAVMPHTFDQTTAHNGPDSLPADVALRLDQSTFTGHDALGRKAWIVHADRVDSTIDKTRIEFDGHIEAQLLDAATGKTRARVTAPSAVFMSANKTLQVGGKLVCSIPGNNDVKDMRLQADLLLWNVGAKQISCPGAVHADLGSDRGTADGTNLTLDLTTHEWTMQQFHGAFYLPSDDDVKPSLMDNPLGKLPL